LHSEFKIRKDGRLILLPLKIGSRTVSCLVDTGASLSAFDISLKDALGEPRGERVVTTPAGRLRVRTYAWPEARLGDQLLESDQSVTCLELERIRQIVREPIFGVIVMDLLASVPFQVDFDRGILRFLASLPELRDELRVRIPVRFGRDGTPMRSGTIDGDVIDDFVIDTGAQGNSLQEDLFDALFEQEHIRVGAAFESVTANGAVHGQRGRLDAISVGWLKHQGLRFSRVRYSSLGLRYFSRYVVTFDFPGECIYLRRGAHHARPEPGA
jgi:predicted aspartyl protease